MQQFIMIVMMYLIGIHPHVMNVYPQVMSECSIQKEYWKFQLLWEWSSNKNYVAFSFLNFKILWFFYKLYKPNNFKELK